MKRILALLLAALALLSLSACGTPFQDEYYYETPFSGDFGARSDRATEIRNYSMLLSALTNMIASHRERGEFRFVNYNGSVSEDLSAACFSIKSEHPLGAYAVESLSYDTSYVVSYYVANIFVSYKRSADELQSIVYAGTERDVEENVLEAVDGFAPSLVLRSFLTGVDERYFADILRKHYFEDPLTTVAEPYAEVTGYPAEGSNRIFDLRFRYAAPEERVSRMRAEISERLEQAKAEMQETEQPALALEGARMLSEACAGGSPDALYADTPYGALVLGSADSKGYALAYRALCTALGVECAVVVGSYGAVSGQEHFWNIIRLEDDWYHVDVSAFAEDPEGAFLVGDEVMWGAYIWDTAAYPACGGPLRYADVAGIPEGEEPPEQEGANAEEPSPQKPPTETAEPSPGEQTEPQPTEDPSPTPEPTPEPTEAPTETPEETPDGGEEKTP